MPKKEVSETKGMIVHAYRGHDDNLWWSLLPPRSLISGEPRVIWIDKPSQLFDEILRLSAKIAAKKLKSRRHK